MASDVSGKSGNKRLKHAIFNFLKIKVINLPVLAFCSIVRKLNNSPLKHFASKLPLNRKIKAVTPDGNTFFMKTDGSDGIATEIYWYGLESYEFETINAINELLKISKCFFDIGANTGIYSLLASSKGTNMTVHSFEPVERAFKWLEINKGINSFDNMHVNKIALSNYDGETSFNVQKVHSPKIPLGSSIREDMGDEEREIVIVPSMKLDSYIRDNGISAIDLIKIDTEGTEDRVFEGANEVLETSRPFIICEVLANLIEVKLQRIFIAKKYKFFIVSETGLKQVDKIIGDPVRVSNYLFIPEEKIDLVFSGTALKKSESV